MTRRKPYNRQYYLANREQIKAKTAAYKKTPAGRLTEQRYWAGPKGRAVRARAMARYFASLKGQRNRLREALKRSLAAAESRLEE